MLVSTPTALRSLCSLDPTAAHARFCLQMFNLQADNFSRYKTILLCTTVNIQGPSYVYDRRRHPVYLAPTQHSVLMYRDLGTVKRFLPRATRLLNPAMTLLYLIEASIRLTTEFSFSAGDWRTYKRIRHATVNAEYAEPDTNMFLPSS
jgi:hypothetical protein